MGVNTTLSTTSMFSQGAAITVASAISTQMDNLLLQMLPFCYAAIPLIIIDIYYGRRDAKYKYKNKLSPIPCTLHNTIMMTTQKILNYISWIFLSVTLSLAFDMPSIVYVIMGIIYGLEVLSLLDRYVESKGIDIDEVGALKLILKFIWSRMTGNFDENFSDIVKRQHDCKRKKPND